MISATEPKMAVFTRERRPSSYYAAVFTDKINKKRGVTKITIARL